MKRILYIDNLRIFLIALVVLHHLAITYGGPGGWYYVENEADSFSIFPLTMFLASNQSFFMGMFFLISAYFTAMSLQKKTVSTFLKDRLIRLGIPLLFFYFILSPLTIFVMVKFGHGENIQLIPYIKEHHGFGFGPMWFVEALLLFSFAYLIIKSIVSRIRPEKKRLIRFPENYQILLASLLVGGIGFLIRTKLYLGWELKPFGFQLPFFTQYIFLFIIGIVAFQNNWLESISYKMGIQWFVFAQVLILIVLPVALILGVKSTGNLDGFFGGWTWQSLSYSLWEQVTGFALIIGLTGIFKTKFNSQGKLAKKLSLSAYTVYIIHPLVLVSMAVLFKNFELYHLLKYILLAPIAVVLCFFLSSLISRLPLIKEVV